MGMKTQLWLDYSLFSGQLFSSHRAAVSVLTVEDGVAFVSPAVGVPPSLETLEPKSRAFRRLLAQASFLQPNGTTVAVGVVEIFGNP